MGDDESQADRDAQVALAYAVNCVTREDQAPRAGRTVADIVEGYAIDLLDQLDGSVPRALSAARAACLAAASEVAHPGRWRSAMRAVELCRRAAGVAAPDEAAERKPVEPDSGHSGA
jgi:hypothetical protein